MKLNQEYLNRQIKRLQTKINATRKIHDRTGTDNLTVWAGASLGMLIGKIEVYMEITSEMTHYHQIAPKDALLNHHKHIATCIREDIQDTSRENIHVHPDIQQKQQRHAENVALMTSQERKYGGIDESTVITRPPATYYQGYILGYHEAKWHAFEDVMLELDELKSDKTAKEL